LDFINFLKEHTSLEDYRVSDFEGTFEFKTIDSNKNYACPFCKKTLGKAFTEDLSFKHFKDEFSKECDCEKWKLRKEKYKQCLELVEQLQDLENKLEEIIQTTKIENLEAVVPTLKDIYLGSLNDKAAEFDRAFKKYLDLQNLRSNCESRN